MYNTLHIVLYKGQVLERLSVFRKEKDSFDVLEELEREEIET